MTGRERNAGAGALEAVVSVPDGAGEGSPVIVLMHGRGADPSDLVPIRPRLPSDAAVVFPRAPHHGLAWGYGPGWAWYRYEGGTRPEPDSFRDSQAMLEAFLEALPETVGFEPGRVILGGFSQGGTMALGYALRNPGRLGGVLVFSGFLPEHPSVRVEEDAVSGTPIWWGHGTLDPAVLHGWAVEGRESLRAVGADLEVRDYRMGHAIAPEELEDAMTWLAERVGVGEGT